MLERVETTLAAIKNCLLNDDKIPEYFYEHPITLTFKQKKKSKIV